MSDPNTFNSEQSIWNEGRVVGQSAYETYVKQHASEYTGDEIPFATEREWLAASLASGASILLWIGKDTSTIAEGTHRKLEYKLPVNSWLGTANTVVASFFDGNAECINGSPFARKVTDYGTLISNISTRSPANNATTVSDDTVPTATNIDNWDSVKKAQLRDYARVIDGIIVQPGEWSQNTETSPTKLFSPALGREMSPTIRLHVVGPITEGFWVLLTGFTMRAILAGSSKLDGAEKPQDGDFLGPEAFPWANKIVFSMPNAFVEYFIRHSYTRTVKGSTQKTVKDTSIVDLRDANFASYYSGVLVNSAKELTVSDITAPTPSISAFIVHQRSSLFPPALFGTLIGGNGSTNMYPIDTVAPGTIKMFDKTKEEDAKSFETNVPNNYALIHDRTNDTLHMLDSSKNVVPVAVTSSKNAGTTEAPIHVAETKTGDNTTKALSMAGSDGTLYSLDGNGGTEEVSKFNWRTLLNALYNNKWIDTLGKYLTTLKSAFTSSAKGKSYTVKPTDDGVTLEEASVGDDGTYGVKVTIGGSTVRALKVPESLNDSKVDGKGGTLGIGNQGYFTWKNLLDALDDNKRIGVLSDMLTSLQSGLDNISGQTGQYAVTVTGKTVSFTQVHDAMEMPNFTVASIRMTPTANSSGKTIFSKLKLDVFGYTNSSGDNDDFSTVNTVANLNCIEGDYYYQYGYGQLRQPFKIEDSDSKNAVKRLVELLESSSMTPTDKFTLFFTSGGRPLVYGKYTSGNGNSNEWIGAPMSYHVEVSAVINIRNIKLSTIPDLEGVVFLRCLDSQRMWTHAPTSATYSGGVTISELEPEYGPGLSVRSGSDETG